MSLFPRSFLLSLIHVPRTTESPATIFTLLTSLSSLVSLSAEPDYEEVGLLFFSGDISTFKAGGVGFGTREGRDLFRTMAGEWIRTPVRD